MFMFTYFKFGKWHEKANKIVRRGPAPAPKADDSQTRSQARKSCKSAACYGGDWHPRLITTVIWDRAYLKIQNSCAITHTDASYRLSNDLTQCTVAVQVGLKNQGNIRVRLMDGEKVVCQQSGICPAGESTFQLTVENNCAF